MLKKNRIGFYTVLLIGTLLCIPFIASTASGVYAQGNSITGGVFGIDRQPVADVYVELLNYYGQSVGRTRTNGAGRYMFVRLAAERYKVRVLPYGTDYEEQEQDVEVINYTQGSPVTGGSITSGTTNEQRDFYLRLRKGIDPAMAGVVFVQDVPAQAKKLYEQGVSLLNDNKKKEAYEAFKGALDIFPKYFWALDKLGKEYMNEGFFAPAAVLLNIAVDVNPRSYSTWHALAHSLYNLKRYDEGLKAVEKAVSMNSADPAIMLLSGVLMRYNKRFEEAEKQMLKAKELAKDRAPQIHWELALLYANDLKRYADAAKELRIYVKAAPNAKDPEQMRKLIASLEEKAAQEGAKPSVPN